MIVGSVEVEIFLTQSSRGCGESLFDRINRIYRIGNVANVKVLPIANTNTQLETGNIGTGNIPTMATLEETLRTSRTSREIISSTAQAILDARALYPDSSLADLYDPLTMPPELRKAHAANDRAVFAAYGLPPDTPESEIVAHLMKLYQEISERN